MDEFALSLRDSEPKPVKKRKGRKSVELTAPPAEDLTATFEKLKSKDRLNNIINININTNENKESNRLSLKPKKKGRFSVIAPKENTL